MLVFILVYPVLARIPLSSIHTLYQQRKPIGELSAPVPVGAARQHQDYEQMHNKGVFANFAPDPQLSATFSLGVEHGEESLWVKGKEVNHLLIQIVVNSPPTSKQKGIQLYVIQMDDGTMIHSQHVQQIALIDLQVNAQLYQVLVRSTTDKKVQVGMCLKGGEQTDTITAVGTDLKKVLDQTQEIFFNSLQKWQTIEKHRLLYQAQQERWMNTTILETCALFLLYCLELLFLRRLLSSHSVI